jgi:hypothetical protein
MDSFDLVRGDGSFIENEYQNNKSEFLGVIFSGLGYSYKNPLLYYSRNLILENKIDYFGIDFNYTKNKTFMALDRESRIKYYHDDNEVILNKVLELSSNYKKLILIGKSLGTSTINHCIHNDFIRIKSALVLLTPSNEWEGFVDEIVNLENRIFVAGSLSDKLYKVSNLPLIYKKKNINVFELRTGDHSLESDNTIDDIEQVKTVMKILRKFILKTLYAWSKEPSLPLLEDLNKPGR